MAEAKAKESKQAEAGANETGKAQQNAMLKITWVRSSIGYNKRQRETIASLGLHRLNQTVEQPDNPQVRGQINKVKHMLEVDGL
ncbi:MAG: 50S ribosomal protein L30 [Chloroflexia bacterium]